jgi:hypothetical protein
MSDEEAIHELYKDEELIVVRMRAKDYRRMMTMIERDEAMNVVSRYVKTILLSAAAVIAAWFYLWDFVKDRIIGS